MSEHFKGVKINVRTGNIIKHASQNLRGLTFDDVTIKDLPTSFHPNDVELKGYITRNICLNGVVASAAMDTVTEDEMAKAMARNGCIGVIHRNQSPEEQAEMVRSVKRRGRNNCRVRNPVTFRDTSSLSTLQLEIERNNYNFTSFPILDEEGRLMGLITGDEMDFAGENNPEIRDIMKSLKYVVTAQDTISDEDAFNLMKERKIKKLPLLDNEDKLNGMYLWKDLERHMKNIKNYLVDEEGNFLVAAAVGFSENDMERVDLLFHAGCDIIVLDSSHGACEDGKDQLERIKSKYPRMDVIVGNVASYESAKYLLSGSYLPDGIKCGIGGGSICTTRRVTGIGTPQLTAISEVYMATQEFAQRTGVWIPVISDGGTRYSGDIVKALAFGASVVMTGSILAATYEAPGQVIRQGGEMMKIYRGMGSREAMGSKLGSRDRYLSRDDEKNKEDRLTVRQKQKVVPEGIQGMVKVNGSVEKVLTELHSGIKAGLSHCGSSNLEEFRSRVVLLLQSPAGVIEGNPHSVMF